MNREAQLRRRIKAMTWFFIVGLVFGTYPAVRAARPHAMLGLVTTFAGYTAVYAWNDVGQYVTRGIYRVPEPKILAGSNYADLGFDLDESTGHIVTMCAIDNLMKGASGTAVQCMNLMMGWDETLGLEFAGLHPI